MSSKHNMTVPISSSQHAGSLENRERVGPEIAVEVGPLMSLGVCVAISPADHTPFCFSHLKINAGSLKHSIETVCKHTWGTKKLKCTPEHLGR